MAPLRDVAATSAGTSAPLAAYRSDRSLTGVRRHRGHIATGRALAAGRPPKKVDPPGGTTGRVGFSTEVDEAPVLDANPREAFSGSEVVWLEETASQTATKSAAEISNRRYARGPCNCRKRRTGEPSRSGDSRHGSSRGLKRRSRCRRSRRQRGRLRHAPAERLGLRLGGGSDRAGNGKGGESESGELGLDRHGSLHPVLSGHCGPHASWTERAGKRFENPPGNMVSSFIS